MTDTAIKPEVEAAIESVLDAELYELPATYSEVCRYMRAAIAAYQAAQWQPTHQHRKGGLYCELMRGLHEKDLAPVVVYKAMQDGTVWVRYASEFDDGRFTQLPEPPKGEV